MIECACSFHFLKIGIQCFFSISKWLYDDHKDLIMLWVQLLLLKIIQVMIEVESVN